MFNHIIAILLQYYYEPGSGRKFRSTKEIERYLNGEEYTPRSRALIVKHFHCSQNLGSRRMIISGGKMLRLDDEESNQWQLAVVAPRNAAASSPYNLPDGWVVEEVPRSSGGSTDKYYYEPGTGQKFRSLVAVEKHLTELKENTPLSQALADLKECSTPLSKALAELKEYNTPLAEAFKLRSHAKWVATELWRRKPHDLASAMAIVERLEDFKQRERSRSPRHKRAKDGGDSRSKSGSPRQPMMSGVGTRDFGAITRRRRNMREVAKRGDSRDHKAHVGPI
ncbi:hypothetical protein RJ640_015554 [Escallonia rubra]|uniref:MBD domain-containing protein n=1 Tax=Escallonia rubra TaxID=112253 RepID=A0AA88S367_9ASTE|nr:hypothetical protein RJ640_015554 [Escallonia rubra]